MVLMVFILPEQHLTFAQCEKFTSTIGSLLTRHNVQIDLCKIKITSKENFLHYFRSYQNLSLSE